MKSKIIFFLTLISVFTISAQTKVGTVNSDLIIGKMPQMQQVLVRIENYGKKLDSTFQVKLKDYQANADAAKANVQSMTEDEKKAKFQELASLEQELNKFRQNGTQLMQIRRDEYMRPLYKKLSETISEIAKANGYTQILTTDGNEFGYIDERFDITKLVMDKLGIKE